MKRGLLQNVKKHSPTLLCIAAAGGVAVTAVLAAKETPKAISLLEETKRNKATDTTVYFDNEPCGVKTSGKLTRLETFITVVPAYIPAIISGTLTVACIFGANVLNKRQQAAITSAYVLLNEQFTRYKHKVVENHGIDAHEHIMRELAVEKAADTRIYTPGIFGGASSLEFEDSDEETHLFYDSFSDRYFESTFSRVLIAEQALNRNAQLGMLPSLNDFYELLGLDITENGENIGWSLYLGEYMWIDFNHIKTTIDEGLPCWIIECSALCEPSEELD